MSHEPARCTPRGYILPGVTPRSPTLTLRARIRELRAERAQATLAGLDDNRLYMDSLRGEEAATRAAYVGAAVTEIATLRAALSGPLQG